MTTHSDDQSGKQKMLIRNLIRSTAQLCGADKIQVLFTLVRYLQNYSFSAI